MNYNELHNYNNYDYKVRKPVIETYKKKINFKAGEKLLDLGCGGESFMKAFEEYCGLECFGIDLEYTSKKVFKCNLENQSLPFRNEFFDYIHLHHVIEHIWNYDNLMKECHRVLKPNGKIIIVCPNIDCISFKDFYFCHTHIKPYSLISLKNMLLSYNFNVIACEPKIAKLTFSNLPISLKLFISKMKHGHMIAIAEKDKI